MRASGWKWLAALLLVAGCGLCAYAADDGDMGNQHKEAEGFVVHEWGVTRIFQQGGAAECDAPDFVMKGEIESPWDDCAEKPVIYFYSPKNRTVDVAVGTPQYGQVLYWPPATAGVFQDRDMQNGKAVEKKRMIDDGDYEYQPAGEVFWQNVEITSSRELKNARAVESKHWWATSRQARANVLSCASEREKFLFYEVPDCNMGNTLCISRTDSGIQIDATLPYDADGKPLANKLVCKNVFVVQTDGTTGTVTFKQELEIPATQEPLNAQAIVDVSKAQSMDVAGDEWAGKTRLKLQRELEAVGFYTDEAEIIADIWNHDFFQKAGNRFVYFLDRETYDKLMPLYVSEAPDKTVRLMMICIEY